MILYDGIKNAGCGNKMGDFYEKIFLLNKTTGSLLL